MQSRLRRHHFHSSLVLAERLPCCSQPSIHRSMTTSSFRPAPKNVGIVQDRLRYPYLSIGTTETLAKQRSISTVLSPSCRHSLLSFVNLRSPTQSHRLEQVRYFDYRKAAKKKPTRQQDNPFKVLKIHEGVTLYKVAKKKFLKIAMSNHPDMVSSSDEDNSTVEEKKATFIRARIAFEQLAEDPMDGLAIMKDDLEDAMENFDSWFQSETGLETPFQFDLDPQTMKEVAAMTDEIGGGLDRDGGMWALARMVTASVKAGSDAATVLRLEAGDVNSNKTGFTNGSLRRVRKR